MMSFPDLNGVLWPTVSPGVLQDEPVIHPGVRYQSGEMQRRDGRSVVRSLFKGTALLAGATTVLTIVLFLPVLYGEMSSIEAVGARGEMLSASEFVTRLKKMFFGTAIVAFSLVCLVASAAFASKHQGVRVVDGRKVATTEGIKSPRLAALIKVRHV